MSLILIGNGLVGVQIEDAIAWFEFKEHCECCGYLWADCYCGEWPTAEEERKRMSEEELAADLAWEGKG